MLEGVPPAPQNPARLNASWMAAFDMSIRALTDSQPCALLCSQAGARARATLGGAAPAHS